ncbi:MAG: hypothetical protein PQJ46_16505 [Spirochaetales bacterium]|nr:hypothetical protein [Spirochaetales bacterium]
MKKLVITSVLGFIFLTICTISLGIIRNNFVLNYIENEILAKAILLPVNIIYILFVSFLLVNLNKSSLTSKRAILIGVIWASLALFLDFFVGYYGENRSTSYLLEQLNIFNGNTWLIVLLLIAIMPVLVLKLKEKS